MSIYVSSNASTKSSRQTEAAAAWQTEEGVSASIFPAHTLASKLMENQMCGQNVFVARHATESDTHGMFIDMTRNRYIAAQCM